MDREAGLLQGGLGPLEGRAGQKCPGVTFKGDGIKLANKIDLLAILHDEECC